jgi:hypothetical protein
MSQTEKTPHDNKLMSIALDFAILFDFHKQVKMMMMQ